MAKRLLFFIILCFSLPVAASVMSDAVNNRSGMVYLYSQHCGYCVKFEPIYRQLEKKYGKTYKFKKISADMNEGRILAKEYGVYSVPTVLVFNSKIKKTARVVPECMFDISCLEKEFINFIR